MSPETRKHLYVGAAIITLAGAAIWLYEKAKGQSSSTTSAADAAAAQAQTDQTDALLGELALSGGGGGGGITQSGPSTVSPNTVAQSGTDVASELASIFSSLGISSPTTPATAPTENAGEASQTIPDAPHNNVIVAKEPVPWQSTTSAAPPQQSASTATPTNSIVYDGHELNNAGGSKELLSLLY